MYSSYIPSKISTNSIESDYAEELLSSWASPPGDAKAQEAYRQIQVALNNNAIIKTKTVDINLQGSYRNRTHIRADSDVMWLLSYSQPSTMILIAFRNRKNLSSCLCS